MTNQPTKSVGKFLKILHFNDVYDIEENKSKPGATEEDERTQIKAGASRFLTAWKQHDMRNKLCLFSGDLFSPSLCKYFLFSLIDVFFEIVSSHFRGE